MRTLSDLANDNYAWLCGVARAAAMDRESAMEYFGLTAAELDEYVNMTPDARHELAWRMVRGTVDLPGRRYLAVPSS